MSIERTPLEHNEWTEVEKPLIDQLLTQAAFSNAKWQFLEGSRKSFDGQGRDSFREVLLKERLQAALKRINKNPAGEPWLDQPRINQALKDLDGLRAATGQTLMERNQAATRLILEGTVVDGVDGWDQGKNRRIQFIDWKNPANNEFLIINQFRVDEPMGQHHGYVLPDVVLFVNGIPLVVIECKSPATTNPIEEAINQLLRYSNQRHWVDAAEGNEKLFYYAQLMIATDFDDARMCTPGGQFEHYLPWKDCYPTLLSDLAGRFDRAKPSAQQVITEGVLKPEYLLDIVRHFTLFMTVDGRTIKIAPRYQQYRAVVKAMERLDKGKTKTEDGEFDRRGGVIFHTQGSGKSLTMVFLIRRMRSHAKLASFKIVFVTDRTDLQNQLSETAELTGDVLYVVGKVKDLPKYLKMQGPSIVFAMVQKYRGDEDDREGDADSSPMFDDLNTSEEVLVIADEAHRSHAKTLHANLMAALPNAAKIGFTGTPIIMGKKKRTAEIFGEFIDRYTIIEAQDDDAILPILYEFRDANGEIKDGKTVDQIFEEAFSDRTQKEREAIQKKYATSSKVLESSELIAEKARDMLRHYIDVILPNGFKAQVTATSRKAVLRYYDALQAARDYWLEKIDALPEHLKNDHTTDFEAQADKGVISEEQYFLIRAAKHRDLIARLEFAPVMSSAHNDDPAWYEWTDKGKIDKRIERFKKPFTHKDPSKADPLAFLIVKNMLLVGFDAPIEQVLYIDRKLKEDELLQAIARVNRTRSGKSVGYVVDYARIGDELFSALKEYTKEDIQGAFRSAKQELIDLRDRHARVVNVFKDLGVADIHDTEACVQALRPEKDRAKFIVAYKQFLKTYGNLEHRHEARKYATDAKAMGFINLRARNRYRDDQLNIMGVGDKVSQMIDEYVKSNGVDPSIPPIDLLDAEFKSHVRKQKSDRAMASEMEHAARYHISKKYNEDPEHYKKLSQRLSDILRKFDDDAVSLRKGLEDFIEAMRAGRQKDDTGLDPETQAPFYGVLHLKYEERYGAASQQKRIQLIAITVELVEIICQEIGRINFWGDINKQNILRGLLIDRLDHPEISDDLDFIEPLADSLMEVAKYNHARLTTK
jgi:type I restriction enzyme, R subunit